MFWVLLILTLNGSTNNHRDGYICVDPEHPHNLVLYGRPTIYFVSEV